MTEKRVAVFGSSVTAPGSQEWEEAERVGRDLASAGLGVLTGGYGGAMEAVSKGASAAGGEAIGVTAPGLFTSRSGANPYLSTEIEAATLAIRIGHLVGMASGVVALPGSIGTAAELLIAWNTNHIARAHGGRRLPTVAVGEGWRVIGEVLSQSVGAVLEDVHFVGTGGEAVAWLVDQPEIR